MEFMCVAARVRGVLHAFGVHSSTIQPEYAEGGSAGGSVRGGSWRENRDEGEDGETGEGCLLPCAVPGQKGCAPEDGCCREYLLLKHLDNYLLNDVSAHSSSVSPADSIVEVGQGALIWLGLYLECRGTTWSPSRVSNSAYFV